jgi:integrase
MDETTAERRRGELEQLSATLAERHDAEDVLKAVAAAGSDREFASMVRAVRDVASSAPPPALPVGPRTFRDVAELWLSGTLHDKYPDVVRGKQEHSVSQSRGIIQAIAPHLNKDVREITRADVIRAKSEATPKGVSQATRAHYARHIRIVMGLAVNPLELIEQSPVPPGFVPAYGPRRALGFLYPEEDALLLGVADAVVPRVYRFYYGFLDRNGMRPSEALRLVYGDLDLRRGILTLDKNKTRIPRAWKMADDVTRVLIEERERTGADDSSLVFQGVEHDDLAERFREHLWDAGVQRRELHAVTSERRPIRAHDLRGSFVTIALAYGANEDWVMRRTGHTTSQMLAKYRRQIEHAKEVELGWYEDLGKCLTGESRAQLEGVARRVVRKVKVPVELPGFQTWTWSYEPASTVTLEPKTAATVSATPQTTPDDLAEMQKVARAGHPLARADETPRSDPETPSDSPVERALAAGLTAAIAAQEWELAKSIVNELGERRRVRTASTVPSLSDARAKREKGEGK